MPSPMSSGWPRLLKMGGLQMLRTLLFDNQPFRLRQRSAVNQIGISASDTIVLDCANFQCLCLILKAKPGGVRVQGTVRVVNEFSFQNKPSDWSNVLARVHEDCNSSRR